MPKLPAPATLGGDRPAAVRVPASYDGVTPLPLVVLLAGYSYPAKQLDDWLKISDRIDSLGFALVLAEGTVDSDGAHFWNATDTCCDYDHSGVDDVEYLGRLRREALRRLAIDPERTYLLGHSNGAFMAFRLACDHPEEWTAVASLAGSIWPDVSKCAPSEPVNILHVHGTFDRLMPYAGDDSGPGADGVLARWQSLNGCSAEREIDPVARDYVDGATVLETQIERAMCPGRIVEHWKVGRAGHEPLFRPVFTDDLIRWLLSRR